MKLFVATHNQHKIREISQILPGFEIVPDDPEGVEENAPDFAGNALIKVRAIAEKHKGEWCMADDSGLEVKALGGAPGVHSARYAGEPSNTPANNALLLKNLEGVKDRAARFTCCCALVDPSGEELVVHGHCPGHIAEKAAGVEGFGYDPFFIPNGHDKSFAELSAEEKNAISHRGRALEKVREIVGNGSRVEHVERVDGDCKSSALAWLKLFRVVNLPTVPGDVLVGAAVVFVALAGTGLTVAPLALVFWAALASVFLYLFGLVDNDIVGAKTDRGRPIADGEISLGAARLARFLCLAVVIVIGICVFSPLTSKWLVWMFALACVVVAYNRTKFALLMGLARGLNALGGAVAVGWATPEVIAERGAVLGGGVIALFCVWTIYIWAVTWYSKGEEDDPEKKRRVGALVGGIVYLQLTALLVLTLMFPQVAAMRPLLIAGAVMLILLRLFKTVLPKVSAS